MMLISLIFSMIGSVGAYRIKGDADQTKHFVPYEIGNVGNVHQFTTAQTWSNQYNDFYAFTFLRSNRGVILEKQEDTEF